MNEFSKIFEVDLLNEDDHNLFEQRSKRLAFLLKLKRIIGLLPVIAIIVIAIISAYSSNDQNSNKDTIVKPTNQIYYKTSFDCNKSVSYVEKTICTNDKLAKLDISLNVAYKSKLAKAQDKLLFRAQQKKWVQDVEGVCTNEACIANVIKARIDELHNK